MKANRCEIHRLTARKKSTRILSIAVLIVCSLGLPSSVYGMTSQAVDLWQQTAQTSLINMHVFAAFEGNLKFGEWLPIWVELENNGNDLLGEVQVRVIGSGGTMVFTAPAEMPTASHKRITLYVLPNNFTQELTVQFLADGQQLAAEKVKVTPHVNISYFVGLIAQERGTLALIEAINPPGTQREKVLIDIALQELPERYEGLRSFDLLVINNIDTSGMTPGQASALAAWVNQGGQLVVGGGGGAPQTLSGLTTSLLPFAPQASQEFAELPALQGFPEGDKPIQVPGPFLVATGQVDSGNTLISQDGIPLLMEWGFGKGKVDFVALDLNATPFDAWSGTIGFWEKLLALGYNYPAAMTPDVSARQQFASAMPYPLSTLPVLDLPSAVGLAVLLSLYILAVGPLNYLYLKWKKRLHLAWVTIPAITILFSAGSFGLGYALHGADILVNKIAIIELQPNGKALVNTYIGLFSPGRDSYEIEVPSVGLVSPMAPYYDPWNNVGPGTTLGSSQEVVLVQSDPSYVRGLTVDQWSMQTFQVEGVSMDFGKIEYALELKGNNLVGKITNRSTTSLEYATVILSNRFVHLGDVPAGQEVPVLFDLMGLSEPFYGAPLSYRIFEEQLTANLSTPRRRWEVRRSIIENLFERGLPIISSSSLLGGTTPTNVMTPVLVGWIEQAPPEVRVSGRTPSQESTAVVILPMDYSLPSEGNITFPMGLIPGQLIQLPRDGGYCGEPGRASVYIYSGEAQFLFRLPEEALEMSVDMIQVNITTDSGMFDPVELAFYNWSTDEWRVFPKVEQGIFLVPEASELVDSSGQIKIRLTPGSIQGLCYSLSLGLEAHR